MKKQSTAVHELILGVIIILLLILPQLIGTTTVTDESAGVDENGCPLTETGLKDLEAPGTRFGILTNLEWERAIKERFPDGEILHYNTMANMYAGLEAREIDAAIGFVDERQTLSKTHPEIALIEEPFAFVDFGFGTAKNDKGKVLCRELNRYLSQLKESGEYDELRRKWEDPNREGDVMGDYTFSGEKGSVKIVTGGLWTPMTFYQGETLTGEFLEIMNGFCSWAGYTPEFVTASFSAELAGLASGTYDVCADSITSSKERLESIYITDPLMTDEYYLYTGRKTVQKTVAKAPLFFRSMKESIRRTFITEDRYKILLSGLKITILLSVLSIIFGTLLGAVICFLRMRRNPFVSAFASLYIKVFRSLPIVVLLLIFNYIVFRKNSPGAFWICVISFSIGLSAYCCEIFRGGINAVPSGQARAAAALGFGRMQVFWQVIWPQALIHLLPAYSGQLIATVKMTAVAGYISVIDLTKASDIIRSRTYEAFFPLIVTSIVYFMICFIFVWLLRIAEKMFHPEQRRVNKEIISAVEGYKPVKNPESGLRENALKDGTGKTLIHIEHLTKHFEDVTPVRDVNCDIRSGDIVSIIGPSGTGKSTLLYLMNHLEEADGGVILFDGKDTRAKSYDVNRMREQIGMVFQQFNLFSHLTVIENLMLAQIKLLKRSRREAIEHSLSLLQMVGMTDKALSLPSQLSGGQQQRIAIIRAVAMDPKIILFDEPTSALDPAMVGEVLSVIRKLARDGLTMLIVTHEMRFARDVSNRVFYMDEGIIYEEGTPHDIFDMPKRDKTRQFVNRLRVLELTIEKNEPDHSDTFSRVEHFGAQHLISAVLRNRMQTMVEELCIQTIQPVMNDDDSLRIVFEFSESDGGSVNMKVTYPGPDQNPLEMSDPLSQALIRHVCQTLSWECRGGVCTLEGKIT